jgi:hypothetical protein
MARKHSVRIEKGLRAYFVDAQQPVQGTPWVHLATTYGGLEARLRQEIDIPIDDLMEVLGALTDSYLVLVPTPPQSQMGARMSEQRLAHTSAYEPWTTEDDARLVADYEAGIAIPELSQRFNRGKGAIQSRLIKLLGPSDSPHRAVR